MLQTAYLITGDRHVAEEVMQEAFVQAFRFLGQLRAPDAFSSWLYRLTLRQAQRVAARERAQRGGHMHGEAPPVRAIEGLPEQQRTAVVLHYFQDLPVAQIATAMDAAEGTVKSWLHRGRAALARALAEPLRGGGADG